MLKLKQELDRIWNSSLARNASWMFVGQGVSLACVAVYFILVGRLLGSAEYGKYVGAMAMVSIVSRYSSLGSQELFFRYVSPNHKNFSLYWANVLVTTFTLGSLFVILLSWLGPHIAHTIPRTMILCVALSDCLCAQVTTTASRVFLAMERVRMTVTLGLLVNLLRTILAALMLWQLHRGTALQWAVAVLIVSAIAATTAVTLVTRFYGKPTLSPKLLRQRIGEGFVFALSDSTISVYNDIDKAMLGHYGMNVANGIYAMAYRVTDVSTTPITSIHAAAYPRFFRRGVDGIKATAEYGVQILKRTGPLALLATVCMFLAAPLIPYLVGKDFHESTYALRWLCLLPFFRAFQLSAGDGITGAGYQRIRLCGQAGAAGFNFLINLYLIPRYSWHGAAWSSLATDGLLGVFNWIILFWLMSVEETRGKQVITEVV
jgi:O-antigen/teichoic acid export membrane protein